VQESEPPGSTPATSQDEGKKEEENREKSLPQGDNRKKSNFFSIPFAIRGRQKLSSLI
jgi:hypothetical protein